MKEIKMKNSTEYKLNDFYQAVILKVVGFPLLRLERGSSRFFIFVFSGRRRERRERRRRGR